MRRERERDKELLDKEREVLAREIREFMRPKQERERPLVRKRKEDKVNRISLCVFRTQ